MSNLLKIWADIEEGNLEGKYGDFIVVRQPLGQIQQTTLSFLGTQSEFM